MINELSYKINNSPKNIKRLQYQLIVKKNLLGVQTKNT